MILFSPQRAEQIIITAKDSVHLRSDESSNQRQMKCRPCWAVCWIQF